MNTALPNSLQPSPYYYTDVYNQPITLRSNFLSNRSDYLSLPTTTSITTATPIAMAPSSPSSSSTLFFIDKNKNNTFYNQESSENQNKLNNEVKQKSWTLEKNRIAALKCRERKKLWVEKLTKTHDQRLRKNKILRRKILELKEESQQLRNQLILHSNCQCNLVNHYIRHLSINNSQNYSTQNNIPY